MPLTQALLKSLLSYDPETGIFTWLVQPSYRAQISDVAGSINKNGYRTIQIKGRKHKAHRLAHLYMTGEWPPFDVDHEDEDKANNRWTNLRPATRSQNMLNKRSRSDNKSGVKGVSWDNRRKMWHVQLQLLGKKLHVGHFAALETAKAAIQQSRSKLHGEFANHGMNT